MAKNLYMLPPDLPVPEDDGACDHLVGLELPSIPVSGVYGSSVDLSAEPHWTVVFFYCKTGKPERPPMIGWNKIPGARGCTTECCAFRDRYHELQKLGVKVYGVSAQSFDEQQEAAKRLHLPYELLNDSELALAGALGLPTFEYDFSRYIKRLTLVLKDGVVEKVYYPVFPPHLNVTDVVAWFEEQGSALPY